MSSRDIGPALPPHMRKNHGNVENKGASNSKKLCDEGRYGSSKDERRKWHKDKYDDRNRHRDKDRERRTREESRDWDRPKRYNEERKIRSQKEREGEREKFRKEKTERSVHSKQGSGNSARHSKRSKTDRTYNTDTEESSDDRCDSDHRWDRMRDSDCADSDSKEEEAEKKDLKPSCDSGSTKIRSFSKSPLDPGPALPPHLSKALYTSSFDSNRRSSSPHSPPSGSEAMGPSIPPHLKTSESMEQEEQSSAHNPAAVPHHLKLRMNEETEDSDDDITGPALPPHFQKNTTSNQSLRSPPSIGPTLPPQLVKQWEADDQNDDLDIASSNQIGPALPPHLKKAPASSTDVQPKTKSSLIGPALPPGLLGLSTEGSPLPLEVMPDSPAVGSKTSSEYSSDDEVLGPLLPDEMTKSSKNYLVQAQLERNAAAVRRQMEEKDLPGGAVSQREEWMLHLPPEGSVDLGLGPRTFRARGAPEKGADRSMWTDTPADKARKEEEAKLRFELGISSTESVKKAAASRESSKKDKSMEDVVKKHKRSKESLLESHHKKLKEEKRKKEKAGVKQERRPFNRETDLKTNVFDDAQKKAIYKKAQLLDSRFSKGESKYL